MTKAEFISHCNSVRKANKNKWYFIIETVDGHSVKIKGFNTWVQIFDIDGIKSSGTMDCSVKQFNNDINAALNW